MQHGKSSGSTFKNIWRKKKRKKHRQGVGRYMTPTLSCDKGGGGERPTNRHLGRKLMTLTGEAATPTSMTVEVALAIRVSTPFGAGARVFMGVTGDMRWDRGRRAEIFTEVCRWKIPGGGGGTGEDAIQTLWVGNPTLNKAKANKVCTNCTSACSKIR